MALARAGEAAGLDALWLPDHLHQFPDKAADRLDAWTLLGALAAETSTIRLGLGVCNVQLRNPALVAKMAFTLDQLSNGRFDLVLGTGGNAAEMRAYGITPVPGPAARDYLRDTILTVRALESGGPANTPEGSAAPLVQAYCRPGPVQRPFPLAVAADHPETMRLVARYADCWYANLYTPERFAAQNRRMTRIAETEGRDPATLKRTAHVLAILGESEANARAAADAYSGAPRARLFEEPHLVGTADDIAAGLNAYRAVGADAAAVFILNLGADHSGGEELLLQLARCAASAP